MANDLGITPADLFRLSNIACSFAQQHGCGIADAIDQLERHCGDPSSLPDVIDFARTAKRFRRSRDHVFGVALFRDPAWDMLLELLIADADGRHVSTSSLCLASGVPPTTALRYLDRLEQQGVIVRHDDTHDQRRSFVELVGERKDALSQFMAQWCREALRTPVPHPFTGIRAGAPGLRQQAIGADHHPVFL